MRNLLVWFCLFIGSFGGLINAQTQSLKTADSVEVTDGYIAETAVVMSAGGEVYLEFLGGDRVAKTADQQIFDGEILPPVMIEAPARAPRARMREVVSFEVMTDSNEPVELIDQYAALHAKKRLRLSLSNPSDERRQGAQLIKLMDTAANVTRPALWRYRPDQPQSPWQRLGGLLGDTPESDTQVFSAFLYATGQYTIWDENPSPEFVPAFPLDDIELAEPSPFPSVTDTPAGDNQADLSEFMTELSGSEALMNEAISADDLSQAATEANQALGDFNQEFVVPAVDSGTQTAENLAPAVTSQLQNAGEQLQSASQNLPTDPVGSLRALPENFDSANYGSGLLTLPPVNQPPEPNDETSFGQQLQASTFTDFGVEEGDLPEAGGWQAWWALLLLASVIGFSIYALKQKPY